jgi:menaquinone-dependent protoporphyrinogen oxidase
MRVLVAVASKHGSTYGIASVIAEDLRAAGVEVDLHDVREVSTVEGYGAVILGSAIYAGSWLPEARSFAEEYRDELSRLPVWLFSSGPLGAEDPQPPFDLEKFAVSLGDMKVRAHQLFVGKLDPDQLGFGERLMGKMVGAPSGDFRDWAVIRSWAAGIGLELKALEQAVPAVS